ncbi:TIGR03667 family PPOX class F420-dependent oxidoreductase [Conexibacter woesei]|uniref:PPOX class putative F420-dependent enzyme n=1 Tax=Conexibacter woesei (strain DSM 14684 / CCUG 47730 / CIP 108061 / JCM 11494 / NBRC 100937 / ID131577) TaxID=469383 RepID=D3F6J7_CONWI|nr:TIGR03667 family PPOX class F420-dependent oxidoreductase [Conexibacter woesei]ADB50764.1 PPOX class putative F420-dependent enzyme [Conexibacter woesei DSM 14684]
MLPNLDDAARARAETRLRDEHEVWITTVRSDGQPQSSPVGFLWDGHSVLIVSQPGSRKVRNLRENPRVALHLEVDRAGDGGDGGILTLEGVATVDPDPIGEREAAAYADKYEEEMRSAELTPEALFADYSAVIRVRPTRVRAY